MTYQVIALPRRYKLKGEFHKIHPNQPIRTESGDLVGITNPRYLVHTHSYGGEAPFFAGIAEGKLLGTKGKDPNGKEEIYIPFRIYHPDTLDRMEIVDMTEVANKTATVHSFMVSERTGAFNTLDKPIRFVNVEFEGVCTILMSYLLLGDPEIGMKIRPIFKTKAPTYTITDLAFVPADTSADKLPEGYTFSK